MVHAYAKSMQALKPTVMVTDDDAVFVRQRRPGFPVARRPGAGAPGVACIRHVRQGHWHRRVKWRHNEVRACCWRMLCCLQPAGHIKLGIPGVPYVLQVVRRRQLAARVAVAYKVPVTFTAAIG